jgi:hypothetical protein
MMRRQWPLPDAPPNLANPIQQMTEAGLRFAPAGPGDEAAYTTLRQALAAYDQAARDRKATK